MRGDARERMRESGCERADARERMQEGIPEPLIGICLSIYLSDVLNLERERMREGIPEPLIGIYLSIYQLC